MNALPASLWNSRAPYATYLEYHKDLNRFLRITRASYAIAADVAARLQDGQPIEALQPHLVGKPRDCPVHHDFKHLRQSYCQTIRDFRGFIPDAETALHRSVVISTMSLFESFTLCWVANMLLECAATDQLDGVQDWKPLVRDVLERGRFPYGSVTDLLKRFPGAQKAVSAMPPVKRDARTKEVVDELSRFEPNALIHGDLWRSIRNCLVHRHGLVDEDFIAGNQWAWERLRRDVRGVPPLVPNSLIALTPGLLSACLTVHDQLAKAMRNWLMDFSGEQRGHLSAPGPYRGAFKPDAVPPTPPLVLPGEQALLDRLRRGGSGRQAATNSAR